MAGDMPSEEPWCELEFGAGSESSVTSVSSKTFCIGRTSANDRVETDQRVSSKHCLLTFGEGSSPIMITDTSTNGTFVNGAKLGKGKSQALKEGDKVEIVVGEPKLTFTFRDLRPKADESASGEEDDEGGGGGKTLVHSKTLVYAPEDDGAAGKSSTKAAADISEEFKCPICLCIFHKCVTTIPCMHNFCSSCYSQTMDTPQARKCPQCRVPTTEVRRNHTLANIVEKFLEEHPELKRSAEDLAALDAEDKITTESLRVSSRKRRRRDDDEDEEDEDEDEDGSSASGSGSEGSGSEESEEDVSCYNCHHDAPDGFRCVDGATHEECDVCGTRVPERAADDGTLPAMKCEGCNRRCCGAYYKWCNRPVLFGDTRKCWATWPGALESAEFTALPPHLFSMNRHERALTEQALRACSFTPSSLFQHCVGQARAGRLSIDSTYPDADNLNRMVGKDSVCRECAGKLYGGLAFQWRTTGPDASLPVRPDCYYGVNCRTQTHNESHRLRYNHAVRQVRFH